MNEQDREIVEHLRRQSEFYAANPRVDAGPDDQPCCPQPCYCDETEPPDEIHTHRKKTGGDDE